MMTKILLLEDESSLLTLMRRMLEPYNLIETTTAEQALRLFYQNGRQVDLLVADVTLPTSSGIQVALILRQEIPELPVILTSGYPVDTWGDRDSADLDKLGSKSVAILAKPFQRRLLLNAVRELTATSFQSAGAEQGNSSTVRFTLAPITVPAPAAAVFTSWVTTISCGLAAASPQHANADGRELICTGSNQARSSAVY